MTTRIQAMRRQHDEAENIAAEIMAIVGSYRDEYDAIPIARLIGKLNALLRVHLAYEDTVLYPLLMNGGDREIAELAGRFCDETSTLAQHFEEFARRWSGPTVIAGMFDYFRLEATALFATLAARIERENDQLFPLAVRTLVERAA
jgi:iron-sulfur cluster repair protein YtfE (RIC family)